VSNSTRIWIGYGSIILFFVVVGFVITTAARFNAAPTWILVVLGLLWIATVALQHVWM